MPRRCCWVLPHTDWPSGSGVELSWVDLFVTNFLLVPVYHLVAIIAIRNGWCVFSGVSDDVVSPPCQNNCWPGDLGYHLGFRQNWFIADVTVNCEKVVVWSITLTLFSLRRNVLRSPAVTGTHFQVSLPEQSRGNWMNRRPFLEELPKIRHFFLRQQCMSFHISLPETKQRLWEAVSPPQHNKSPLQSLLIDRLMYRAAIAAS